MMGATFDRRERSPRATDIPYPSPGFAWPNVQPDKVHPAIVMNVHFREFFTTGYANASAGETHRWLFYFAATLIHETAHALYFFEHRVSESVHILRPEDRGSVWHRGKEARFLKAYLTAREEGYRRVIELVTADWIGRWFTDEAWERWEQTGERWKMGKHVVIILDELENETKAYLVEADSDATDRGSAPHT
ncbi:hypothetical protein BU16DRAFT_566076 [Lophium mytilinum]|uniref:Uncharacterized protein n=1 Tax=Lophium mytilinum TaxID=390894 RepID=A0A6A6QGJ4_9PEZI|nr:hypothetical protein BU16DRAFT_566076 [Lophium mytilinum]